MKKIITLLAIYLFTVSFAQTGKPDFHKKMKNLVHPKQQLSAGKTTTIACIRDSTIYQQRAASTFVNIQKAVYGYDWAQNNNSRIISTWNNTAWELTEKYYDVFDGYHNDLSSLYQTWDPGTNSWENSSQVLSTYTGISNLTLKTFQQWDPAISTWTSQSKYSYTYDAANNPLVELDEEWVPSINAWRSMFKSTYTYAGNNAITEIGEAWTPSVSALQNNYKISNTYDALDNVIGSAWQNWNTSSSSWVNASTVTASYSGTLMTQYTQMDWNSATSTWTNSAKVLFTYNANGYQTSETGQAWVAATNSWQSQGTYIMTYDANNNLLTSTTQQLNHVNNTLENYSRDTFTYDANNNQVFDLYEEWDASTSSWLKNYNVSDYYNCTTVGIKELSQDHKKFALYPNPSQSELFISTEIEYSAVQVLNISGQIIISSNSNEKSISVSNLEKGIYFIQLLDKNNTALQIGKFIKE